ncbi:glycosyltransferase [Clostridium gasigenes]|uniref:glycosyltransferase n=1 Tax=Clostridium gasigenes TaxID=94869 RepID=UPI001C0CEE8F|nr:glycosyltransferase [Clostridium gasigenes]MBU3104462.1 glycosyltransferase [Clostridium gasigenes]
MKILQINSVCGVGSTGRIATELYKVLEEQGHECIIGYGRGTAPDGIKSIKIGSDLDNYMHVAKTRIFDKQGFGSTKATKEFIRKVEEYNPDIIHLHNIHGYYINIEVLFEYLSKSNKPVVWTLHDCWAFTGHCAYFDYVGCNKWKSRCSNCEQKNAYPSSSLLDNSKLNYLIKKELFTSVKDITIITPSNWLARLVKESFLSKYPVKVINNGIDLDVFKPSESKFREIHGLKDETIVLGVASVWEDRKGLKYLIELAEKLDLSYKVVIVGVDEKQKSQMPKNIIAITRTNSTVELAEIYTVADLFVNPTLEDNFPTTNLEALACGTPVITFETGGSVECIEYKCGEIVKKSNSMELIKVIKKSKECFDSEKCVEKARIYNKQDRYKEYIDIYKIGMEIKKDDIDSLNIKSEK